MIFLAEFESLPYSWNSGAAVIHRPVQPKLCFHPGAYKGQGNPLKAKALDSAWGFAEGQLDAAFRPNAAAPHIFR